jgi:thiol:disulfide interchange protein DsbD
MVALGLSLSGVVDFGTRWMGTGQNLAAKPGLSGSFFTGVLAVVVASPCTAPFMGTALGYALTQPAIVSLSVFLALALGLAFPFLLLGFVPRLAAWLPRPGAWMHALKQVLAFPLYLTAVWLLWVLGGLTDRNGMGLAMVGVVALAFGLWLLGRARHPLNGLLAAAALIGAVALLFHPLLRAPAASAPRMTAIGTEAYSDARLAELVAQKRTVFVDFTADWCLTCKVNESIALRSQKVIAAFARHQVVTMVADWTRADPEITAALARYQRSGVPLYLVSVGGSEPRVLPQVLTPDLVAEAVGGP